MKIFPRSISLFGLLLVAPLVAQTVISGGGNYISGSGFYLGAHSGSSSGFVLTYDDSGADVVTFRANRVASWLWENYDDTTTLPSMRLDQSNNLILYNGTDEGVKLNPIAKSLRLGTHANGTLTADVNGVITAGGGFSVAGNFTNTNGSFTGGSSGLTLNAGGTGQSVTLNSSGGDLIFKIDGTERARMRSSGDALHLASPAGSPAVLRITAGTDRQSAIILDNDGSGFALGHDLYNTGVHNFGIYDRENAATRFLIDNAGNVGIGTPEPASRLHVAGRIVMEENVFAHRSPGNLGTTGYAYTSWQDKPAGSGTYTERGWIGFGAGDGSLDIKTAVASVHIGTPAGRVLTANAAGNVGIGTPAPDSRLTVVSTAGLAGLHLNASGSADTPAVIYENSWLTGGKWLTAIGSDGDVFLGTKTVGAPHYTLALSHSGNVGIGTSNPGAKLDVSGPLLVNSSNGVLNHYRNVAAKSLGDGTQIGTLKITLPKYGSRTMLSITICGYDYSSRGAWAVTIGGYNYSDHVWYNPSAKIEGRAPFKTVRLAHNGANDLILLGDMDTAWTYASVEVTDVLAGYDSIAGWAGGWTMELITSEAGIAGVATPAIDMYTDPSGNIGIGTTNPGSYRLAVKGRIRAEEVVVDTGWADYVFEDDYRLAPLAEVEAHIKEKRHLPGIPSAAEVATHGVNMGDMQSKLLSKVEELTLHLITQQKEIAALREQVAALSRAAGDSRP